MWQFKDSSADMGHMGRILKYTYSPDTPAEPDTELTVYSLLDNSYIRQVAAVFQKKYPDIYLNLEVGMTGEDGMTTTDALKTLNTEIMAGNGPDVMILDVFGGDQIEKGMLADISSILDKAEEEDGILDNIRESYREEDGQPVCNAAEIQYSSDPGKQRGCGKSRGHCFHGGYAGKLSGGIHRNEYASFSYGSWTGRIFKDLC